MGAGHWGTLQSLRLRYTDGSVTERGMVRKVISQGIMKLLGIRPPYVSELDRFMHQIRASYPASRSQQEERRRHDAVVEKRDESAT